MISHERILVMDGQTIQALACVRSLGRTGRAVFVASHQRAPLAAWSRYCRGHFRMRGQTLPALAPLRAWARGRGISLVLPLTERACLLCNAERGEWEAMGITVGCGPDSMLFHAFDKARTLELAAASGVSFPPTRVPDSLDACRSAAEAVGYPCVVKQRFSNAWDGSTFLPTVGPAYVGDPGEFDAAILPRKQGQYWPIVQAYVPGQGKGIFALCDRGRTVAWFAHERLRDVRPTGSGSSLRRSVALDPRLQAPAERLLARLEWHGPAMVEFRDDGVHAPALMEVNGRFWGSLQLAIAAGTDFPALWVRILGGEDIAPSGGYREQVTLRWLWGDVKRFLYILQGPPRGYPGAYPSRWQGLKELLGRQPAGTRIETWDVRDPWPALGEWVQGIRDLPTAWGPAEASGRDSQPPVRDPIAHTVAGRA